METKDTTSIKKLLESLSNEFCIEQFEEISKSPSNFIEEAKKLIDEASPPLKSLMEAIVITNKLSKDEKTRELVADGMFLMVGLLINHEKTKNKV